MGGADPRTAEANCQQARAALRGRAGVYGESRAARSSRAHARDPARARAAQAPDRAPLGRHPLSGSAPPRRAVPRPRAGRARDRRELRAPASRAPARRAAGHAGREPLGVRRGRVLPRRSRRPLPRGRAGRRAGTSWCWSSTRRAAARTSTPGSRRRFRFARTPSAGTPRCGCRWLSCRRVSAR